MGQLKSIVRTLVQTKATTQGQPYLAYIFQSHFPELLQCKNNFLEQVEDVQCIKYKMWYLDVMRTYRGDVRTSLIKAIWITYLENFPYQAFFFVTFLERTNSLKIRYVDTMITQLWCLDVLRTLSWLHCIMRGRRREHRGVKLENRLPSKLLLSRLF